MQTEPKRGLVRPMSMSLRYLATRIRGWYALALASRGPGAPVAPELDARIVDAIRHQTENSRHRM